MLSQRASCSASSVYQPRTITLSQSPTCLCQPIRAQCGEGAANERLVMCREPRWAPWHYCRDCTGPVDVAQQPPSLAGTQSDNPLTATPSAPPAPCLSSPPLRSPPACWVSPGLGSRIRLVLPLVLRSDCAGGEMCWPERPGVKLSYTVLYR